MNRSFSSALIALLATACSLAGGSPVSYEVITEPVAFHFDADPQDRVRIGNIAEELEPYFPDMSWRIGTYDPSGRDGIVVLVEERQLRNPSDGELRTLTAFVIFDRGQRLGIEEFENCSIYRADGDCFAIRRIVSTIKTLVKDSRSGPDEIRV